MFLNPRPAPDGKAPPIDLDLPPLNPEIAKWFEARQNRLAIVKTTHTPSGQTLDWIPIESQDPKGRIATPPPTPQLSPLTDSKLSAVTFELDNPQVERGPAGTVPMLRKNLSVLHDTRSLEEHLSKRGGLLVNKDRRSMSPANKNLIGYFHVTSGQNVNPLYGCEAWLNVWQPYVQTSNDHSLMQCGLQNYDKPNTLESLEAGWICDQHLNGDWVPHLFTYYTTNGYTKDGNSLGGYNDDVGGWQQYDTNIFPGVTLGGLSAPGGAQAVLSIKYQLWQSNWWFAVLGRWIGYYPALLFMGYDSLFGTLANQAEWVGFWGEVYTALSDPYTTHTQMGSGDRAEAGYTYACFQRNLRNQTDPAGGMTDHDGTANADDSPMYDIQATEVSDTNWGSYFFGGGSGEVADGRLEIFVPSTDGNLYHLWQIAPNGDWNGGWEKLTTYRPDFGASVSGSPAVGSAADGRLEIFVPSTDGNLYHLWQIAPNGDWNGGWEKLTTYRPDFGASVSGSPAVGSAADGRLEIFVPSTDGNLYHLWQIAPNGDWNGGWEKLTTYRPDFGASVSGSPAVGSAADRRLEIFVPSTDGNLYHLWQIAPNGDWNGGWEKLTTYRPDFGASVSGSPAVGRDADRR